MMKMIMDKKESFEELTHSFVVKLWVEELTEASSEIVWRGHITHIATGNKIYIKEIPDILDFVAHFLEHIEYK